jgi:hypothetical protein
MSKQTELAQVADTITVDSGNVGIGVVPESWYTPLSTTALQLGGTTSLWALSNGSTDLRTTLDNNLYVSNVGVNAYLNTGPASRYQQINGTHRFHTVTSGTADATATTVERMRIESSGTIDVGVSGTGVINASNNGYIVLQAQGNNSAIAYSGGFYPGVDNSKRLGIATARWSIVYAATSSINTSDRNEKQDIEELSDAEQRVAVVCKSLIRKFKFNDAVEAKGNDARIHVGIIAQDLQAAFASEGLDASRYAMFCSDTWWETQTEVPAVEAVAEVLDEEGNVVTEAVEAVDAYTRTDTYDTQEEAPEGATERTRLGVRYSELLAFIIGAL